MAKEIVDRHLSFKEEETIIAPLKGKNYLFTIGIDKYKHLSSLNNAVRDTQAIKDLLISQYQFEAEYTTTLINEEASRENILDALYNLESTLTEDDNFLLYYAGHGVLNEQQTRGYWIPAEAKNRFSQYVSNSNVRNILKDFKARHIYLLIDSCFSGSMILRKADSAYNLMESMPSRRVLTSGRKQVVTDGPKGGHSPFANSIIQYLRASYRDSISALDLEYHVQVNTPRNANQQPVGAFIYGLGDQSGQFVFRRNRNSLNPKWQKLKGNLIACRQYITDFPNGDLLEEVYWEIASLSGELNAFQIYAHKYRQGKFILQALKRIESFKEEQDFAPAKIVKDRRDSPRQVSKGPIEMVFIEGGRFMMGGGFNDVGDDQNPMHEVTLFSFEMSKYPITKELWQRIMGDNPSDYGKLDCPAGHVSWHNAQKFLKKINREYRGMNYRLPTEAEWEFAARGGNISQGYIYSGSDIAYEVAWYDHNSGYSQPVGQKESNELGLYDMSGNIWEWCNDWYGDYSLITQDNPRGPEKGERRVQRGGAYNTSPLCLKTTFRSSYPPGNSFHSTGFRVVRTPSF